MTTIISQETIKPSSPTPPHLKTHNLSILDHFAPDIHMSCVFFYQNYNKSDINILKNSLSKCLTLFYPFAGRLSKPFARHIECNDEGVEFLEAFHDSPLEDFILNKEPDEILYQFIPNGLGCIAGKSSANLVEIQLTNFTCGGAALAVTISHKIADGLTSVNFYNQWAVVTRGGSLGNMNFFSSSTNHAKVPEYDVKSISEVKYVTRRFVFPNSKLNELKKKVSSMGMVATNLSRVEVLTSLIFKCAVDATTTKSGFFQSANLFHTINLRNKIIKNDPEIAAGNVFTMVTVKMEDSDHEITLNELVAKLRKEKMELEGLKDVQEIGEYLENRFSMLGVDPCQQAFTSSSLCRFPFYEVDFGWGKPVKVALLFPNQENKGFFLMDTPQSDGIEAIVHLPQEVMAIFQEHKELIAYVDG